MGFKSDATSIHSWFSIVMNQAEFKWQRNSDMAKLRPKGMQNAL